MVFDHALWTRLEFEGTPIYVRPDKPDWFVPNQAGDDVLRALAAGRSANGDIQTARFLQRLPCDPPRSYPGRAGLLSVDRLSELWLHVTNRCNLACTHCLFASSPSQADEMPADRALELAGQAWRLGGRLFALTGGESFVHRQFGRIVEGLLALEGSNVVILTNGTLLAGRAAMVESWPRDRVHLQVSVDGLRPEHDRVRGEGAFDRLMNELAWLKARAIPFTVSMCPMRGTMADMPGVVELAASVGASNVHFMWYFVRGRGDQADWAPPERLFEHLRTATARAERLGVGLDNIEALKGQVFAPAGTVHDGSGSGWDSLAVGPDGMLYPSPALVGAAELATEIDGDLARAWRDGEVLQRLRRTTAAELDSPLRLLLGGGDADHSYARAGRFTGADPYTPLHERTALWLIAREASRQTDAGPPALRLKMGDLLVSCGPHGPVATVHSNCLLAVARADGHTTVKQFYAAAVSNPREDIRNPVHYPAELIEHIPDESRVRSYGCGSPVLDADLQPGECVVDLGCGTGVECFIAARLVGRDGRVIGVDMLDVMLEMSRRGAQAVADRLGYRNLDFRKGYLEELPVDGGWADAVLSNCVVNLATDKRRVFSEIRRVLRPGGRLMIADVVCDDEPDAAIRNDETLRGQCIAGALTQRDLFGLLSECGLVSARVVNRLGYRVVRGHPFYSMTFEARAPKEAGEEVGVIYRGPAAAIVTASGAVLPAGVTCRIAAEDLPGTGPDVFVLDESGAVTNVDLAACASCGCMPPEEGGQLAVVSLDSVTVGGKHMSGCMVCGAALRYLDAEAEAECSFCGRTSPANALCEAGHFVCDACHTRDARAVIERICLGAKETDLIALLAKVRSHEAIPVHGPEHHGMVPGIILAAYRNLGGQVTDEMIRTAIHRGLKMIGGSCGFLGVCGAAAGVGVAFAVILASSPLKPTERKIAQDVTQDALARVAAYEAARCCQRDSWLALRAAADLSAVYLPIALRAEAPLTCTQWRQNAECMGPRCPLWPG